MIELLISAIVACLIVGLLLWAIANLPFIPAPMGQILRVVIIVVACLWLISMLLGHGGFGFGHSAGIHIN
jgi:hypothetical protein